MDIEAQLVNNSEKDNIISENHNFLKYPHIVQLSRVLQINIKIP